MNARTLDEVLHHWPAVVARAENDWAKGFALSIHQTCVRRGWQPSPKQMALMQMMVAQLFAHAGDDDFPLIEGGYHAAH